MVGNIVGFDVSLKVGKSEVGRIVGVFVGSLVTGAADGCSVGVSVPPPRCVGAMVGGNMSPPPPLPTALDPEGIAVGDLVRHFGFMVGLEVGAKGNKFEATTGADEGENVSEGTGTADVGELATLLILEFDDDDDELLPL